MKKIIQPFSYAGFLEAPKSKSYLQRAIALAALAKSKSEIIGFTASKDVLVAMNIARALGAKVQQDENKLLIIPPQSLKKEKLSIFCGEAGLSTRMFAPIAAILAKQVTVEGEGSILERPMNMVIDALEQLGGTVQSNNSFLPLKITGKISAGKMHIDASESSQLLTGLLLALPILEGNSEIHVDNLQSKPYIDMTHAVLQEFGISVSNDNYQTFYIKGKQRPAGICYEVEGDWSGAAFHLVGAAISGSITINGLQANSAQADRKILDVLEKVGATVKLDKNTVKLENSRVKLHAFEFDATHCPDLFPPLAALAACCKGTSIIHGVERLQHKESNRGLTLQEEFRKLGIKIEMEGNTMTVVGGKVKGGTVSSRNDHRIAMSLAVLATVSDAPITIENAEAVNKSYPAFFEDLLTIGHK